MKALRYEKLLAELSALVQGQSDETSVLANAASLIKASTGYFWVGFYMVRRCTPVKPDYQFEELRLGPFQGAVACYRIGFGKGVCGRAWALKETIVVDNVEEFPGHIACSSLSRSEIVIPLLNAHEVAGVLDIDSTNLSDFDTEDKFYLEKACEIISKALYDN